MTTITTTSTPQTDIRWRREQLGLTRLALAIRARVSQTWLAALEAGLEPTAGAARARVMATLDELEHGAPLEAA